MPVFAVLFTLAFSVTLTISSPLPRFLPHSTQTTLASVDFTLFSSSFPSLSPSPVPSSPDIPPERPTRPPGLPLILPRDDNNLLLSPISHHQCTPADPLSTIICISETTFVSCTSHIRESAVMSVPDGSVCRTGKIVVGSAQKSIAASVMSATVTGIPTGDDSGSGKGRESILPVPSTPVATVTPVQVSVEGQWSLGKVTMPFSSPTLSSSGDSASRSSAAAKTSALAEAFSKGIESVLSASSASAAVILASILAKTAAQSTPTPTSASMVVSPFMIPSPAPIGSSFVFSAVSSQVDYSFASARTSAYESIASNGSGVGNIITPATPIAVLIPTIVPIPMSGTGVLNEWTATPSMMLTLSLSYNTAPYPQTSSLPPSSSTAEVVVMTETVTATAMLTIALPEENGAPPSMKMTEVSSAAPNMAPTSSVVIVPVTTKATGVVVIPVS